MIGLLLSVVRGGGLSANREGVDLRSCRAVAVTDFMVSFSPYFKSIKCRRDTQYGFKHQFASS